MLVVVLANSVETSAAPHLLRPHRQEAYATLPELPANSRLHRVRKKSDLLLFIAAFVACLCGFLPSLSSLISLSFRLLFWPSSALPISFVASYERAPNSRFWKT